MCESVSKVTDLRHANRAFFLGFKRTPFALVLSNIARRFLSCSSFVRPNTRISSTIAATPGSPSYVSSIFLWNSSCAEIIPKGRRRKRYRPTTVLNVVSFDDSSVSLMAQYPHLASSTLKYLAPESLEITSSRVGNG